MNVIGNILKKDTDVINYIGNSNSLLRDEVERLIKGLIPDINDKIDDLMFIVFSNYKESNDKLIAAGNKGLISLQNRIDDIIRSQLDALREVNDNDKEMNNELEEKLLK
jgi:hypothetical protein